MANRKTKEGAGRTAKWLEIVNWKKAQPKMRGRGNTWMKLYTSLLDHEGFWGLDDASRVLIVTLWMYAARSGRHVFPADPKWLHKRIPLLKQRPNFKPLLDARDELGNPTPFLRYCPAPPAEEVEPEAESKPRARRGTKRAVKPRTQKRRERRERREEKRIEQTRGEQKRVPNPSGFGKEKREKKTRVSLPRTQQIPAQQSRPDQGQKPVNPQESEVGQASASTLPRGTPAHSVHAIRGVCRIGDVMKLHWLDADAEAFGWAIVEALGIDGDRNEPERRSQWGSFAAWWTQVKAQFSSVILAELREKAIAKANYVRMKNRRARRPGAVWHTIMRGELAKFGSRAPPAAGTG